ncbi:MAG TPA: WYL domain-containing protein [Lentimicrobium sp.]|nr:WYL domain-containing protein [Lentimicrobium sp.]
MSKRESITRYSLIIKKLRRSPASFEEIADYLDLQSELEEYNFNISKRTFQRDLNDIREVYKIDIRFDKSQKQYYIDFDEQPEINERILEAFDTFNALNMSDRLSNDIHFEKRKPQGAEHLFGILHAIRNRVKLRFNYYSNWDDESTVRLIEPLALKEFRYRWYILGEDSKDGKIKTFGLDRITELEISKQKFEFPADFNVNEYFKNCFGIISPNAPSPSIIRLEFKPVQGKFIKSLPLHESQRIIADTADGLVIELTLYLTYDLLMEILSYGGNVKVLEPEEFKKQVKLAHEEGFNLYNFDI